MTKQEVLDLINEFIVANGSNEITANVLRPILTAILTQPNNYIGDLEQLNTVEQSDLVSAINELAESITTIANGGVKLHEGISNPNDTTPSSYSIADFYIQKDTFNNPIQLWQFNGISWIEVGNNINFNAFAYPEKKIFYAGSNSFNLPNNVQAISVRKNGEPTDVNIEDWGQLGNVVTYLGTLEVGDYLIIGGIYNIEGGTSSGSVNSVNDDDNGVVSVDNSNPTNPVVKFNGVFVDGTTITGKGTEEYPLIVIGGGGGVGPSLITKFTSTVIPTVDDSTIVIPANTTWLFDSVPYTNTVVNVLPFDYAAEGFSYFLTIVATKFNTFVAKVGSQSISNPDEPIIDEENELFLTTYLIYDNYIDVIVPPVSPNIYVEKESFAPLTLISSGHIASIELDKRNNIIFSGNITKTGNVIKNNPNHFVIGLPFMTTNKTANPIEIEHLNTSGGSGSIAYFNPEELSYFLQPNEVAIWISEILNGQKIHRRVSSYIDRDSVIFRSGTEAGKHVTGDVEIGDGISLATEEVDGTKSLLKSKNGKWQIEIEDGITNPVILFDPDKGIFSDKLFDLDNDENAYLQKGHIVQLEEDVFNLELNKADLVGGLVPSSQLPAYVDDIIEGYLLSGVFYKEDTHTTAITGEIGKIYVDLTTGQKSRQYRWSGTVYIQITNGLIASTNDLIEGSNLYFTTARVLATPITGLSLVTGGAIVSTDSVLIAFGKVQKNITDIFTALDLKQTKKEIVTNATVSGTYNLDASIADTYNLTLTGNTALALINTSTTYAEPMTVYITGSFSLAYPAGATLIGEYLGNKKNQLVIEKIGSVIFITVNNYV